MRSVLFLSACFILLGLLWAIHAPLSAYGWVQALGDGGAEGAAAEQALTRADSAVLPALHSGLQSPSMRTRLRCARILALRNDPAGEQALLETLRGEGGEGGVRAEGGDGAGASVAEVYLISLWDHAAPGSPGSPGSPNSPALPGGSDALGPVTRTRLAQLDAAHADADLIALLSDCLARDPSWIGGYVRRARANLRAGDVWEARHDALRALALDYNEFEAMALLAQASLLLNVPQDASACMEQALRVNPRLKRELRDDIRDVLKALDAEKERKRRERRKNTPEV